MNTNQEVYTENKEGEDRAHGRQDLRVPKTKKNLKATLRQLLTEKPFEKITVKEICERALTSRITFYNYYSDKYALLDDLFQDMNRDLEDHFRELQRYNEADDPVVSFQNLLDCFLDQYFSLKDIAQQVNLTQNTILLYPYYHYMADNTTKLISHYSDRLRPAYEPERLANFLVFGLYGYIHFSGAKTAEEQQESRQSAHRLLSDFLNSDIFRKSPSK